MADEAILLDTSVLLQITFSDLPWHNAAWAMLERARRGEEKYCVCLHSLAELSWLMSDSAAVSAPDAPELVSRKLREFLDAGFLWKLPATAEAMRRQAELIARHALTGPRALDALIVAVMLERGARVIYTLHPREFAVFAGIRATNPFV